MGKFSKKMQKKYNETNKKSIAVYFGLRALVIISMVFQIIAGSLENAFMCVLALFLSSSVELNPSGENIPIKINDIEKTQIYTKDGNITIIENGYLDIGIIDTMKDLFVNFIGAIVFSVIGFLYVKNRDKYKFTENFIPVKQ